MNCVSFDSQQKGPDSAVRPFLLRHQLPTHGIDLHILAVLDATVQHLHGQRVGNVLLELDACE